MSIPAFPAGVDRLASLVRDGDHMLLSTGLAEPAVLLQHLIDDVTNIRRGLTFIQVLTGASGRSLSLTEHGHRLLTPVAAQWSREVSAGRVELINASMAQLARMLSQGTVRIDGVLLSVERFGEQLYPVPAVDLSMVAFALARFRAVEVTRETTRPLDAPSFWVGEVDVLVRGAEPQSNASTGGRSNEIARRIGAHVASLVPANAVVEVGVGSGLTAVGESLAAAGRPLAVHTGVISDWTRTLAEAGVTTRPLSCAHGKSIVGTVAAGSPALRPWLEETEEVALVDSLHAHDPRHLGQLEPFVAINSAAAVSLDGDVGDPSGPRGHHSSGGLLDFATAGSYGGLSIIAVPSLDGSGRSRIVPAISGTQLPGSLVTHVVTEHGVADLRCRSPIERRELVAGIADPGHRSALLESPPG